MPVVTTVLMLFGVIVLLITGITQIVSAAAAAKLPAKGKLTPVNGGKIHWIEEGQGPPILMVHGLGGNLHNFTYALAKQLSDRFRVISIDRPGCGWSTRGGIERALLDEQARMVAEFIEVESLGCESACEIDPLGWVMSE